MLCLLGGPLARWTVNLVKTAGSNRSNKGLWGRPSTYTKQKMYKIRCKPNLSLRYLQLFYGNGASVFFHCADKFAQLTTENTHTKRHHNSPHNGCPLAAKHKQSREIWKTTNYQLEINIKPADPDR